MYRTECYCAKLKRGAAAVSKYYDRQMADSGITISQYGILRNVSRAKEGTIQELADLSKQDKSTMARMVKPLMARGLIYDAKPAGARNSRILLTPQGKQTLARATACWQRAQQQVEVALGKERIVQMEAVLKALEAL